MFYREAGVFKTSYDADMALLPIPLDKYFVIAVTLFAIFVVPMIGNEYWLGVDPGAGADPVDCGDRA